MAIEPKEILEYLGIDGVEKLEDFRTKFEPVYIKKDRVPDDKDLVASLVGKSVGKVTGATQVAFISDLKKMGVDISKDEIKDMPIEKIVEHGLKKASDHFTSRITELEGKAGSGSDEKVKEWQDKYQKLEGKYSDTKTALDGLKGTFEAEKQSWATKEKNIKLSSKAGDAFKAIKWKTGASEIEKKGFLSLVNEKYKIDLDESDELFIADSQGKRIPHPKKNGEFKSIAEILEEEGKAANVWEGNPIAGRAGQPQKPIHQNAHGLQQPAFSGATGGIKRVVSAAARANEGK